MGIFTWIMDFIRGSDDEEGLTPLEDEIADRINKRNEKRETLLSRESQRRRAKLNRMFPYKDKEE